MKSLLYSSTGIFHIRFHRFSLPGACLRCRLNRTSAGFRYLLSRRFLSQWLNSGNRGRLGCGHRRTVVAYSKFWRLMCRDVLAANPSLTSSYTKKDADQCCVLTSITIASIRMACAKEQVCSYNWLSPHTKARHRPRILCCKPRTFLVTDCMCAATADDFCLRQISSSSHHH